jgi:hypothetical protein
MNALEWNRDFSRSLQEIREREAAAPTSPIAGAVL